MSLELGCLLLADGDLVLKFGGMFGFFSASQHQLHQFHALLGVGFPHGLDVAFWVLLIILLELWWQLIIPFLASIEISARLRPILRLQIIALLAGSVQLRLKFD